MPILQTLTFGLIEDYRRLSYSHLTANLYQIYLFQVVKVIDLSSLTDITSRLQYMAVDYAEDGQVYVYISDAGTGAIIVYNVTTDEGYRVILPSVVASGTDQPDALYLALVRRKSCGSTVLYFTYLGSNRMFAIKAVNLRAGNANGSIVEIGRKRNKIVVLGTDNGSAIFFRLKGKEIEKNNQTL